MNHDASEDACGPLKNIAVPGIEPFTLELHTQFDRYISAELDSQGIWEPFETLIFSRLCRAGDVVVDVGANLGWYTVIASRLVGPTGKVVAFEPEPANFRLLSRNVARNGLGNVTLHDSAVADRPGTGALYLSEDNLGDHRLFASDESRRHQDVSICTLDDVLAGTGDVPALVKSDTQGSELLVLEGGRQALFSNGRRPALLLEFWPYGMQGAGTDPGDLLNLLDDLGYLLFEVSEGNPMLVRTDSAQLRNRVEGDLNAGTGHFINLLALEPGSPALGRVME